jgi:hypothetical protein
VVELMGARLLVRAELATRQQKAMRRNAEGFFE